MSMVFVTGVTLWEMFTYGSKPYGETQAIDVVRLLEKGVHLPQPHICSIDLYVIMINCMNIQTLLPMEQTIFYMIVIIYFN